MMYTPRNATLLSLPVELLAKIVSIYLQRWVQGSNGTRYYSGLRELFGDPILEVCKHLRSALINNPILWTDITLDSEQTPSKLDIVLERTQHAELDIVITDTDVDTPSDIVTLFLRIKAVQERWRTFKALLGDETFILIKDELLDLHIPKLQEVQLSTQWLAEPPPQPHPTIILNGDPVNLRRLSLEGLPMSFVHVPSERLTFLCLGSIDEEYPIFCNYLSLAHNLEELTFNDCAFKLPSSGDFERLRNSLPSLCILKFGWSCRPEFVLEILASFSTPRLQSLIVDDRSSYVWGEVLDYFRQSEGSAYPHVTFLRISAMMDAPSAAAAILPSFPGVVDFELTNPDSDTSTGLLNMPLQWPMLKKITIYELNDDWKAYLDKLITSRSQAGYPVQTVYYHYDESTENLCGWLKSRVELVKLASRW